MPKSNKIAIYTAITGDFDGLKEDQYNGGYKYVAYMDDIVHSKTWDVREMDLHAKDDNRNAKWYKLHPHELFKGHEYSVWIDGSVQVMEDITDLVTDALKDHDWAVYKHASRDCIFDEAFACAALKKDDPDLMSKQVAKYMIGEGYPRHNGLAENTIIIRRHNSPKVKELNKMWWSEVNKWSKRDQLSFDYCAWKVGLTYKVLEGSVYDNNYFKVNGHAYLHKAT